MSGGHDNHGHDDHKNESPTEKTKKGFAWLGVVFWGLFLGAIALLVIFFIWRSFFHEDDRRSGQQAERPAASAPAAAPASVGYCVNVPNQRFVAPPAPNWGQEYAIEDGCDVRIGASVVRHLRIQCRDEGEPWPTTSSDSCNGDYRRYQSKLDRPVSGLMIFRPW